MEKLNKTTFMLAKDGIETVVGDEKQDRFFPRIKLKRWGNEANFSIGLKDSSGEHRLSGDTVSFKTKNHTARFYPTSKPADPKPSKRLRWLNLGAVEPAMVPAEYELSRHTKPGEMWITSYWSNQPALMYFGQYKSSDYVGRVDIPEVRAASRMGNPYYMDPGLLMVDVHFNGQDSSGLALNWSKASRRVLRARGIGAYHKPGSGAKLFYKDSDGNDVKIGSPEESWGHLWTYINLDTDYLKAYDFYKAGRPKDIRDQVAYGIKKNYPNVGPEIVGAIIREFAKLSGLDLYHDNFSSEEQAQLEQIMPVVSSPNWVKYADRPDFDWWWGEMDSGFEFEVELTSKPASNIIPLTIQTKELTYHYQPKNNEEHKYRPPFVEGSYAVYHRSKSNNEYQTGKAFHIYRPWAVDAQGNKVWCELAIPVNMAGEPTSDIASITVPQSFLDNAQYPVIVDPTFGYTTAGAAGISSGNVLNSLISITGIRGTIQSISAYGNVNVTSPDTTAAYKFGLYNSTTGAFVGGTVEVAGAVADAASWRTLSMAGSTQASSIDSTDIAYNLVVWSSAGPGSIYTNFGAYYDTVTNAGAQSSSPGSDTYSATWPDPQPAKTVNNDKFSVYVTTTDLNTIITRIATQDTVGPNSTTANVAATYPVTPTQNNLLIAVVMSNKVAGTNTISGWTAVQDVTTSGNGSSITIFTKIAGASEPTTVSATATSATAMRIAIFEYTGNISTSVAAALDVSTNNTAATVATIGSNSVTTTAPNELIIVAVATSGGVVTSPSFSNSFNVLSIGTSASIRMFCGERLVNGIGSYSTTASWTTSRNVSIAIASFKAAQPRPQSSLGVG